MLQTKGGISGKVCSTCGTWKPLSEFPTDPTHTPSQGGRHCRCKECHRKAAAKRRRASRAIKAALVVLALVFGSSANSDAKDKSKVYRTGKLLDIAVEEVTRGIAVISGMAAPIPGKLYVFQIQVDDLVYFAEYKAGKLSYKPDWVVNDPIQLRLGTGSKMFLKRPDGKELEVVVVKKARIEDSK